MANDLLRPLLDELAALSVDDRDAVLALLTNSEREQVLAELGMEMPQPGPDRADHSPWLRAILAGQDERVTPAARAALSDTKGPGLHGKLSTSDPFDAALRRAAQSGVSSL